MGIQSVVVHPYRGFYGTYHVKSCQLMLVTSFHIIKVTFRRLSLKSTNFHWVILRVWGPKNMIFFILHRNKNPTTGSLAEIFILNNFRLIHFALKSNFEKIFRNLPKKKYVFHRCDSVSAAKWKCSSGELENHQGVNLHKKNWKNIASHVTTFLLGRFRTFWKYRLTSTTSWRKLL